MEPLNLYAPPARAEAEIIETLLQGEALRLERIVSNGHSSPPDFWYDQAEDEWVALLKGSAAIRFADGSVTRLTAGDSMLIPRHVKHRVEEVSADAVWLALHHKS